MNLQTKPTDEQLERLEKISECVRKGSLIIGASVGIGAVISSLTMSPLPVYMGTSTGYALAINYCYKHYHDLIPNIMPNNSVAVPKPQLMRDESYHLIDEKDKIIFSGCKTLPRITELNDVAVINHKNEGNSGENTEDSNKYNTPNCSGGIVTGKRFKTPSDNDSCYYKTPCLKREEEGKSLDKKKKKVDEKEKVAEGDGDNRFKFRVYPLKRFTNPSLPSDTLTQEEALKETFRSYPLKRFKNSKRVITGNPI